MTKNFDKLVKIFLEDGMTDAGVLGADGPYPTDDSRTPFTLGIYSRRGKVKTKKRKKRKIVKEEFHDSYWQEEACGALAITLHRMYNLPIIIFKEDEQVAHVAVLYKGQVLDSLGIRSINDVKNHYFDLPNITVEKISEHELLNEYMGDDNPLFVPDEEDLEESKKFVLQNLTDLIK